MIYCIGDNAAILSSGHLTNATMFRLVIGVGNTFRRDDGAGIEVVRRLAGTVREDIRIIEQSGEGASLMASWVHSDRVIIVDALKSGNPPGSIRRFDAGHERLSSGLFHYSSHNFSVAVAVEMARELGTLPDSLILYGIEGTDFSFGEGLTEPVTAALPEVCTRIREDLLSAENEAET